jgi:hypothetical protein
LPINAHALARLLKPFEIAPTTHRFELVETDGVKKSITDKGYKRSQFEEAFARYLAPWEAVRVQYLRGG